MFIIITDKLPLHLFCIFVSCAAILAPLILTVKLRLGFVQTGTTILWMSICLS